MKTNKKHIIIPALMMAVGVGLVGSISGTVAWYQYSTRVTAAYIGTSAKASENLQIKVISADDTNFYKTEAVTDGYFQDLQSAAVASAIGGATAKYGTKLSPITTGELAKNAALPATLKGNPIYQYAATSQWADATIANYVQFKLSFRALDVDGTGSAYLAKNVYLTNLTIMDNADNATNSKGTDLSDAVRVHISAPGAGSAGAVNALFNKNGSSTNVYGKLDVNNDGTLDQTAGYEWDTTRTDVMYGDENKVQAAYAANDTTILATDTNATLTGGKALCTTKDDGSDVTITVTIWLEGWQKLDNVAPGNAEASASESAIWDPAKYVGAKFNVGMRFAIQPIDVADY